MPVRQLFQLSAASLVLGAACLLAISAFVGNLPPTDYQQVVAHYWVPTDEAQQSELAAMRGAWWQQLVWRAEQVDMARQVVQ